MVSLKNFTTYLKQRIPKKNNFFLNLLYQDEIIRMPKSDNDNTRKENHKSIFCMNISTKILKKVSSIAYSTIYKNQIHLSEEIQSWFNIQNRLI